MADDYDWMTSYWPQTGFFQAQNGFFQNAPTQAQMQDGSGQIPMRLEPFFQHQGQAASRPPYPYKSSYSTNWSMAPAMAMQHPQPTPPVPFQSQYPTTSTTPSTTPAQAATMALSLSQMQPAPQAPQQQQPQPPAPSNPPAKSTPRDAKRARLEDVNRHNSRPKIPPPAHQSRDLSGYAFTPRDPTSKDLRDRGGLIQPLNDTDAAEKTSYDPLTIAKDILIAAGRHPTELALNHHLFRLRDILTLVDNASDLGTFRWDIVDSATMQVPPTKAPLTKAPSKPPVVNGHTHAHPPQYQLHQQLPANQGPPGTAPLRDQFQPITATPRPTPPSRPQPAVTIAVPPQQGQHQQPCPVSAFPHKRPEQLQPLVKVQPPPQSPHPSQPQRKTSPPRRRSLPAQPQRQRQNKTPKKSKQQPDKMVGKKSALQVEVSIPMSAPVSYPVYSCEWQNCQSELHSLALLRQHLLKSHIPYTITCGWAGCTCTEKMAASDLSGHVKSEHLDPIAWKLGDGPSVPRTVDNDAEEASKDPGSLATPEANQPGGEDSLIFPASYSSIRAFNRVHGNTSQQDKAREIFKAVQRLKERVGVGLDPGGCQLATPERNERVSNDEEVYELHSESESES